MGRARRRRSAASRYLDSGLLHEPDYSRGDRSATLIKERRHKIKDSQMKCR